MSDVLITPASSKIEFKDASNNIDGLIQLDAGGNLEIQAPNGDISLGDASADVYIGNGVNNIDIVFEQNGEIRGLTGVTLTLGQSDSYIAFAGDITGDVTFTGNVTASTVTSNSDIKLKTNISTITDALEKVCKLRGVEFDYIESGEHSIGVIAQEVEEVLPELVIGDETKSVAYGNLTSILIEAVKELRAEVSSLKEELKQMKGN